MERRHAAAIGDHHHELAVVPIAVMLGLKRR
jgi:hypothetical protein